MNDASFIPEPNRITKLNRKNSDCWAQPLQYSMTLSSADDAMKVQPRSPTDLDDTFGSKFMDS